MMYNKDSTLTQLQVIEDNLRRLRTLVEADMVGIAPDINVELYCIKNIELQSRNLSEELIRAFGLPAAGIKLTKDQIQKLTGNG